MPAAASEMDEHLGGVDEENHVAAPTGFVGEDLAEVALPRGSMTSRTVPMVES